MQNKMEPVIFQCVFPNLKLLCSGINCELSSSHITKMAPQRFKTRSFTKMSHLSLGHLLLLYIFWSFKSNNHLTFLYFYLFQLHSMVLVMPRYHLKTPKAPLTCPFASELQEPRPYWYWWQVAQIIASSCFKLVP